MSSSDAGVASASTHHSVPAAPPSGPIISPVDQQPTFTFIVDQDDDFRAKKAKNASSRKAIRSHVMRDVRRRERLAGLKRGTKKETQRKISNSDDVEPQQLHASCDDHSVDYYTTSSSSPSSSSSSSSEELGTLVDLVPSQPWRQQWQPWNVGYLTKSSSPISAQSAPKKKLPNILNLMSGHSGIPPVVAGLIYYWENVFVPTTFPNESEPTHRVGMQLMTKSAFSDTGSFFAFLSICAAHRAILSGQHSYIDDPSEDSSRNIHDPDYYAVKGRCIREFEAKLRNPNKAVSNEAFDTIVGLLTGALIVGLFSEARMHLRGLKNMVNMRGGITTGSVRNSAILASILGVDVKAATGLMTKPVFPLVWEPRPVPAVIQERMKISKSSPVNCFGNALLTNNLLSCHLRRIILVFRDLAFYCEAFHTNPAIVQPEDHDFFRIVLCEIEHQLLSYIYTEQLFLHPIEAVARTASICYLNSILICSPPSSGLGRAMTRHIKKAASHCPLSLLNKVPKENYTLFAWALLVGAQGCAGQVEYNWFIEQLACVTGICGWYSWEQASAELAQYLYLPRLQDSIWRPIWDEVVTTLVPQALGNMTVTDRS